MKSEELTAVFDEVRFRAHDSDFVIATVQDKSHDLFTVKGEDIPSGFEVGQTYRFFGRWENYENSFKGIKERQFRFRTAVECAPFGRHGVVSYLQQAPGIGPKMADNIWSAFGTESLGEFREGDRDVFLEATGIKGEVFDDCREFFRRKQRLEACVIDLMNVLDGQGLPKKTAQNAISEWGNMAAEFIRKNPYLLMRFRGIGFRRCDRMYLAFGNDPNRLRRQALCCWHGVAQAHQSNGSTWVRDVVASAVCRGMIAGTNVREKDALNLALRAQILEAIYSDGNGALDWDGNTRWLADTRKSRAERRLAHDVAVGVQERRPNLADTSYSDLSEHQSAKVAELFSRTSSIYLLGGGPGTGKTYTLACIVRRLLGLLAGQDQIAIAAPTGKAAVRITEALSEYGLSIRARTWHSLLGVSQQSAGDGWGFHYCRSNPLPYKFVVGDESSMLDTGLCESIFAARARGTSFLLIGDVNQLPPVGHGAPFRDMIAAGVPYAELSEVRRNSGEIVEQCRRMREEQSVAFDKPDSNLQLIEVASAKGQVMEMMATLNHLPDGDPVWDCQVIVPTNNSGDLGRKKLNHQLQQRLNPHPEIKSTPFRTGDKVVCTRNQWFKCTEADDTAARNDKGDAYVANGDIGEVTVCEPTRMEITLKSPHRVIHTGRAVVKEKPIDEKAAKDKDAENQEEEDTGTGCAFELAYALSCHKCQGSESPYVIVMLDDSGGARRLCDRSWLYTAISRAKKKCYLIGKESVAHSMVRVNKIEGRKTFLKELIVDRLEELKLEEASNLSSQVEELMSMEKELMEI